MLKRSGSGAGCLDKSELGQGLDPARRISLNGQGFIVRGAVPVVFAALEHKEDRSQNFVADGDDRPFIAPSNHQGLEFRFEDGLGATGGMSELAQQTADIQIALAKMTGFALAG